MTCDQSRDEYISAIEDVAAITGYLAEQTAAYLAAVRTSPGRGLEREATNRQKLMAAVERLVAEERAALERYQRDCAVHAARPRAMGTFVRLPQAT